MLDCESACGGPISQFDWIPVARSSPVHLEGCDAVTPGLTEIDKEFKDAVSAFVCELHSQVSMNRTTVV